VTQSSNQKGPTFGMVPTEAVRDPEVSHAALRVLADLCTYANKSGWTNVGAPRIADDLGMDVSNVRNHLRTLHKLGWVYMKSSNRRRPTDRRVIRDRHPGVEQVELPAVENLDQDETEKNWRDLSGIDVSADLNKMLGPPIRRS